MLQNGRVTAFIVSELLRENQQRGGGGGFKVTKRPHPDTQIRVNYKRLNDKYYKYHLNKVWICQISCNFLLFFTILKIQIIAPKCTFRKSGNSKQKILLLLLLIILVIK